jgi:hypothetical protein
MRTIKEAISECERELGVRNRCYERWVKEGKLSGVDATDRLDRLEAAIIYLRGVEMMGVDKLPDGPVL